MPTEIERKFLVDKNKWQKEKKPTGELFRQGYLFTDPNKTIRVRQTSEKGFLTIKGISIGATRTEYEYEIPLKEAEELLDYFAVSELSKIRYIINFENKLWEIDEFLDENEGLIIAEIELKSEDENFKLPDWIDREVTSDQKYYNSNLTLNPCKDWKE
ncbi:CYTH domain-containing protein [Halpernia sp.]|uniref:CYTH domain-containing protein n=1 Tax=Halpernia sp. TaxID=2782209 RepID=UPI003A8FF88C